MDDDARRELDELRRRAYGRDADIRDDPDALARLAELERRAHDPHAGADDEPDAGAHPTSGAGTGVPRRPRWHTAMTAGAAAVAIVLAGAAGVQSASRHPDADSPALLPTPGASAPPEVVEAFSFAYGPRSSMLASFSIADGEGTVPTPTPGNDVLLKWFQPIGTYFGAQISLADSALDDTVCLLVGSGGTHLRCVSHDLFEQGALLVTVPHDELPESQRPPGMTEDQSIGFWWTPGGRIAIVLGDGTVGG